MPIDFAELGQGAMSSTASGFVSAGIGALQASGSAHYQRRNFRENTHYANRLAIENAKNKYSYEVEALQKAGISLASLGGNFQNAGVTGVPTGDSPAPDMKGPNVDIAKNSLEIASAENLSSQTQKNTKEGELFESQKNYYDKLANKVSHEGEIEGIRALYFRPYMQKTLQQMDKNLSFIDSQKELTDEQKIRAKQENELVYQTWAEQILYRKGVAAEINNRAALLESEYKFNVESMDKRLALVAAQVVTTQQQGKLYSSQSQVALKQVGMLEEAITRLKLQNHFTKETIDGAISVANLMYKEKKLKLIPSVERLTEYNKNLPEIRKLGTVQFEIEKNRYNQMLQKAIYDFQIQSRQTNSQPYIFDLLASFGQITESINLSVGMNMNASSVQSQQLPFNSSVISAFDMPFGMP